jgi:DNA mismatch repair protein MutS2
MKLEAHSPEVDLRGMDTVEAVCALSLYLDSAFRANLKQVRIIHGKGTGALRAAVQQSLKKNKFVKKYRLGVYGEGEDGVTIAELK